LRVHFTEYGLGRLFAAGKITLCAPNNTPAFRIQMPRLKSHEYTRDAAVPGMAFLLYNCVDKLQFTHAPTGEIVIHYGAGQPQGVNRPLLLDISTLVPASRS
jgi:hypothetical protein